MPGPLRGRTVLVAGAGLAGLAAARDLVRAGADPIVVEARDRVGGRVWTTRHPFAGGQHAEAGADMIDEAHGEVRTLCRELGLELARILRGGFGAVRPGPSGRPRIVRRGIAHGWDRLAQALAPEIDRYRLAEHRWDSQIARQLARRTVASWLDDARADDELRAVALGLRGFFLADPRDLSLLALVDQFADEEGGAPRAMYRVAGGNDRLPAALAAGMGRRLRLETELVALSQRGGVIRATVRHRGVLATVAADYAILALPATLLRGIAVTPDLPAPQRDAIARLRYGPATKTLLQFSRRFWRRPGRPRAFASPFPFGALWDGNEQQRGPAGILALLAGGGASDASRTLLAHEGPGGLVEALAWLGARRSSLLGWQQVVWDRDPLARGGYAYFDPAFDPAWRAWLARPAGRLFFAGEHTSLKWQGYMNGAVESGRRAAAEVVAAQQMR